MINHKIFKFLENKNYKFDKNKIFEVLSKDEIDDAYNVISMGRLYPSPLESLNHLSSELKLKNIFIKMSLKDLI